MSPEFQFTNKGELCFANAVSGWAELQGSLRSFDDETFAAMCRGLQAEAERAGAETGCRLTLEVSQGYPPVRNSGPLLAELEEALGPDAPGRLEEPSLAAEDFSFYQRQVPGVFFFLGLGDVPPLHAHDFAFDDQAVLPRGVAFLERLARLP